MVSKCIPIFVFDFYRIFYIYNPIYKYRIILNKS